MFQTVGCNRLLSDEVQFKREIEYRYYVPKCQWGAKQKTWIKFLIKSFSKLPDIIAFTEFKPKIITDKLLSEFNINEYK